MVLSNAERQKRYRQRLKQAAAIGVTAEKVLEATRLVYEHWRSTEADAKPWEEFLKRCQKPSAFDQWVQFVPDDPDDDYEWLGDGAELARSVAKVGRAVKRPPPL
ncbi:MAG: hypothetical protein H0T82_09565 [Sphingomonas sp.]|nr:hypothetical protein [Sphingomonas sp.]